MVNKLNKCKQVKQVVNKLTSWGQVGNVLKWIIAQMFLFGKGGGEAKMGAGDVESESGGLYY